MASEPRGIVIPFPVRPGSDERARLNAELAACRVVVPPWQFRDHDKHWIRSTLFGPIVMGEEPNGRMFAQVWQDDDGAARWVVRGVTARTRTAPTMLDAFRCADAALRSLWYTLEGPAVPNFVGRTVKRQG